jgi:uncharacterized membrane protein YfcA
MTILTALILFIAAVLGGALNSVAGGGSFITFPSLFLTGVLPIQANATSTVALWPGSLASVGAYRQELAAQDRVLVVVLVITSLVGGVLGAVLLLRTPQSTFQQLIPYLLLLATLLFAFSGPITSRLRKRGLAVQKTSISRLKLVSISFFQLIVAIYGGYFGGGIGILMLASLGLMGMENIHEMNALKTILQSCINGVAVITFIIAGAVVWLQAIVMIVGAIAGGFTGAYYARQLDPRLVRGFVILVGVSLTIYFFVRR